MSRSQLASATVNEQRAMFEALSRRFDVKAYRAAAAVQPASVEAWLAAATTEADEVTGTLAPASDEPTDARGAESGAPDGQADDTDLGSPLERAIDDSAGRPLAGILMLSDGRATIGPDPVEVVRRRLAAGRIGGGAAAPVFAVPVGSMRPPTDLAVLDVLAPRRVARGDNAALVATVMAHGLRGRTVNVQLVEEDETLDEQELTLADGQRQQVQLSFRADHAGSRVLTVRVDPQAEEQVEANNQQSVSIDTDTERWKLLYLEGGPRWDFRFLDHALRRDSGLDVTLVMESLLEASDAAPETWPEAARLPEDAAAFAEYDLVMLGDITPRLLPRRLQVQLLEAVAEEGVGLIVHAGSRGMPHAFAGGPLAEALPMRLVVAGQGERPGFSAPAFKPFSMQVTALGAIHPAFQLYADPSKNRSVWGRMPSFHWAAAVGEASPAAQVLAEFETVDGPLPLIAEQFVGRGRVLMLATDSTYRWRRNIGSHLFYRFWGQAIRHTARNKRQGGEDSSLLVQPRQVEPGGQVLVELYAVDERGLPLDAGRATVQVVRGEEVEPVDLEQAGQAGYFRGAWQPERPGEYRLTYTDGRGMTLSSQVRVAGSGRELARPTVDRDTLGTLADLSGGRLLELHQLGQLPDLLEGEQVTVPRRLEAEVWDNWLVLTLLVGLYCLDVGIRRAMGLS
jgi:hypothetical protein